MKSLGGFYAYLRHGQVHCAKVLNQQSNGFADCNNVSQFEASKLNATRRNRRILGNKNNAVSDKLLKEICQTELLFNKTKSVKERTENCESKKKNERNHNIIFFFFTNYFRFWQRNSYNTLQLALQFWTIKYRTMVKSKIIRFSLNRVPFWKDNFSFQIKHLLLLCWSGVSELLAANTSKLNDQTEI